MKALLFVCILLFSVQIGRAQPATATPLLRDLQTALARKHTYDRQRQQRIAVLTAAFRASQRQPQAQFELGLRIYEEYKAFQYDSAFVYSQQLTRLARQLNRPEKAELARLKLAFILLSAGMFKETFEELDHIRPAYLSRADKQDFYFLQARAYSDLGDFNHDQVYRPAYHAQALAYADTALQFSPPGSYAQLAVQQFKALKTGQLAQGATLYRQIRQLPHLTRHQLAVSASTTAYIYSQLRQENQAFELLLVSAIADVQSATKETVALFQLSEHCYRRGDLENAYIFIKEARAQATFYKARQRQLAISHISSIIEGQKISIIEQQRRSLRLYAGAVTLLAAAVFGFILLIFKQLRRLQKAGRLISATNQALEERNQALGRLNTGLHEANQIKQEYIGYYFHNNSQLLDRLETLKNALDTQLGSKQYGAVQRLVSGLNIRQQRQELLRGFDAVFLRLFPQFIPQFNALFGPEHQFRLPNDQLLSTELRIFALIRLGITDSEQISRMLGYSINTIYTYKTRVKNRSVVPNEEFEARIMAIEAV
ncbi:hypothetical protein J7E24_07695 [Hymenobacter sp. ISL-91]|uniref:DUF6377 domain-containing protein n=1 Tax=Hymenobacter sp. ISL-91 TaxID=2819151 RepID=UPI001BEB1240|nr:DUF6377 domain-containing protein [Hymenobacter sp. ISL-91]MBT2557662.1 hypothetical protein [Hymenobacter sp. ISL-91]